VKQADGTADRKRAAGTPGNAARGWVGVVAQAHDALPSPPPARLVTQLLPRSLVSCCLVDVSDSIHVRLVRVLVADVGSFVSVQAFVHVVRALLLDELLVGVRALHKHLLTGGTVHHGDHALHAVSGQVGVVLAGHALAHRVQNIRVSGVLDAEGGLLLEVGRHGEGSGLGLET